MSRATQDTEWMRDAACVDAPAHVFFPEGGPTTHTAVAEAKHICKGCPVRMPCLEYALDVGEQWGVWGGLTAKERRRIRRGRRSAA